MGEILYVVTVVVNNAWTSSCSSNVGSHHVLDFSDHVAGWPSHNVLGRIKSV